MEELIIVITSIIAGMATYGVSITLGKGAVFGSAIVVLAGGLLFPPIFGELGGTMATIATTASYAGMVAKDNVKNMSEMAVVGLINGLLFIAVAPAYLGVGGRLGVIGAIACLTFVGYKQLAARLAQPEYRKVPGQGLVDSKQEG